MTYSNHLLMRHIEKFHEAFLDYIDFLLRGWFERWILCEEIVNDDVSF